MTFTKMVETNRHPKILVLFISIKVPPIISKNPNVKTKGFE